MGLCGFRNQRRTQLCIACATTDKFFLIGQPKLCTRAILFNRLMTYYSLANSISISVTTLRTYTMVNPGAFLGMRKDFLTAQMDLYTAAVIENHVADTVADIQCQYFKRYPMSLAHSKEPTAEWLSQVDDNAADVDDLLPPDESLLDEEAFNIAKAAYNKQVKLLKFRKDVRISPFIFAQLYINHRLIL